MIHKLNALATLVVLNAFALPSWAQFDDEVAIRHGLQLRLELHDEAALAEFQHAYALAPTPRAQAQIALAEQALGRWADANTDLDLALANTHDPWIVANRAILEAARASIRGHLATLEVSSNVASAQLRVNDGPPEMLPRTLRVVQGTVVLDVEAEGFEPVQRKLEVSAGQLVREQIIPWPHSPTRPEQSISPSRRRLLTVPQTSGRVANCHPPRLWFRSPCRPAAGVSSWRARLPTSPRRQLGLGSQ